MSHTNYFWFILKRQNAYEVAGMGSLIENQIYLAKDIVVAMLYNSHSDYLMITFMCILEF